MFYHAKHPLQFKNLDTLTWQSAFSSVVHCNHLQSFQTLEPRFYHIHILWFSFKIVYAVLQYKYFQDTGKETTIAKTNT